MRLYLFVLGLIVIFYTIMLRTRWLTEFGFQYYSFEVGKAAVYIYELYGIFLMMYVIGIPIAYIFPRITERLWGLVGFGLALFLVAIIVNKILKDLAKIN